MNNIIKSKKGFTLVELVIVIVIVGILSVISVPIYRGYVDKAMITEGKVLLGAIAKSELAYHVEHGYFLDTYGDSVSRVRELDIDANGNKYFRWFATESGEGSYWGNTDSESHVYIEVYGESSGGREWMIRAVQEADGSLFGWGPNRDIVEYNDEIRK